MRIRIAAAIAAGALALTGVAIAAPANAAPAPAYTPTKSDLADWGFTRKPNVSAWGGTATIAPAKGAVKVGDNVVLQGTAPASFKPGTKLYLTRFYPANSSGAGSFRPIGSGIYTVVNQNRTFYIHFQLSVKGLYGYALSGIDQNGDNKVIEFQLRVK